MEHITEFCTGCRTCEQVCPKSCISMTFSSEGFLETGTVFTTDYYSIFYR